MVLFCCFFLRFCQKCMTSLTAIVFRHFFSHLVDSAVLLYAMVVLSNVFQRFPSFLTV